MEKIHNLNSIENVSKIESLNFLNTIKNDIIETFPFLTKEERDEFIYKFKQLEEKEDLFFSQTNLVNNIKEVISILKNSHTGLREIDKDTTNKNRLENYKDFIESKIIEDKIGYVRVKSWSTFSDFDFENKSKLLEEKMNIIRDSDSVIIDVRGNDGGNSNLSQVIAKYFIDKSIKYCKIFRRIPGNNKLSEENLEIKHGDVFLDKRLVVITDNKCFSSNEMFILMLKDTGRATTIGQKTGGGSGNPKHFNIKLGNKEYLLRVSTWRMFRNNGKPLEGIGIEPDIEVLKEGDENKDAELEKAIEYLKNF